MISQKKLNAARSLIRLGKIEEGLPVLLEAHEEGNASASASLAEIAAFQGRWDDVIPYAAALLKNPAVVYAGNVIRDMQNLLALVGLKTQRWEALHDLILEIAPIFYGANDSNITYFPFDGLLEFMKTKGKSHYVWNWSRVPRQPEEVRIARFNNAVHEFPEKDPKIFNDPDKRRCKMYSLASVFSYYEGAVDFYDQEGGLPREKEIAIGFNNLCFLASGLARVGRAEEAWQLIESRVDMWWPVDQAQVAPVQLFMDEVLQVLLSAERCEVLLRTPRGPEAEEVLKEVQMEDTDEEFTFTKDFEAFGATEVELVFYNTKAKMGKKQKKTMKIF